MSDSRERTAQRLRAQYAQFCADNGHSPYPAIPVVELTDHYKRFGAFLETISPSLVAHASAAVAGVYRENWFPFDTVFPTIETAVRTNKARAPPKRALAALLEGDMRDLLASMKDGRPNDDRDAAMLLLVWSVRLRKCDLMGVAWQKPNLSKECTGYVTVTRDGGVRVWLRPKRLARPDDFRSPPVDLALAQQLQMALLHWAKTAKLEDGDFLFRPVNNQHIAWRERLDERSPGRRVKYRMNKLALLRGMPRGEARAWVRQFSYRSLVIRPLSSP